MKFLILIVFIFVFISGTLANNDRIRLESLKVITLYQGRLTNGRRSAPVPQLQCIGGSAGCSSFVPQVVQCRNMGSDGYDVQWECKTDMSNKYRFGRIDVNCEGYDYPNDPFVLRGSCGLRYTLDLAKKSRRDKKREHSNLLYTSSKGGSGAFGNILVIAIICVAIFFIYKTCLAPRVHQEQYARPPPYAPQDPPPYPSQDPPPYESGSGYGAPPPPGFRPEFTEDCNARYRGSGTQQQQQTEGGGPGFFTGAFGGAILGYLFGSRGNSGGYTQPYYSTGYESSSYCEPPRRNLYPDLSRRSSSSSDGGTRTASGFGGTSRR